MGVDSVRFAELKNDYRFVDLAKVFNYEYGLNDDPFKNGCHQDIIINGIKVNFRQMCGLQSNFRIKPVNPQNILKDILYYDGKIYKGWQKAVKEKKMNNENIMGFKTLLGSVLEMVSKNILSVDNASHILMIAIKALNFKNEEPTEKPTVIKKIDTIDTSGCVY